MRAAVTRKAGREGAPPRPPAADAEDADAVGLPSDEELRVSLNKRLPPAERIRREMTYKAEGTLKRADEQIAALGIDLDAVEKERAERPRLLPPLPADGPPVAVFRLRRDGEAEQPIEAALRSVLPEASVDWLDLGGLEGLDEEGALRLLGGREAIAICPGEDLEASASGLALLLKNLPDCVNRLVLLSLGSEEPAEASPDPVNPFMFFGRKQLPSSPMKPLEDMVTVAGRERKAGDPPLRVAIVRASLGDANAPARVSAPLPATVGEASKGLRSMLVGGIQTAGATEEAAPEGAAASAEAAAAALAFALRRGVDVRELTVSGHCSAADEEAWDELLLPLVGPELWRLPVEEPRRVLAWLRGWADFNYCRGANRSGPAMRRAGLKTPVEVREVPRGVCIKFAPPGERTAGAGFDGLTEGGLEILVDEESAERPGRLRVRRCSYGWRKKPREGSERAILSKLQRDWEQTLSFG